MWLACPLALIAADVDPQTYLDEVRYLASPELKGRATGTPELEKAASYIAARFQSFGLKPADGKNFELAFPVTLGATLGPNNALTYRDAGQKNALKEGQDFEPFSFSSVGKLSLR